MAIDIHTHKTANNNPAIINAPLNLENLDEKKWYCVGVHPGDTTAISLEKQMVHLKIMANKKNVMAIGECGLDRLCNTALDIQKERFVAQIQLANDINKPLILHCVRAHDDVLQLLKKQNNHVAAVFHGFNNNINIAYIDLCILSKTNLQTKLFGLKTQTRVLATDQTKTRLK